MPDWGKLESLSNGDVSKICEYFENLKKNLIEVIAKQETKGLRR